MYLPKHFAQTDIGALHRLIGAHPLGALVTLAAGGLEANHIPFLVQADPAPYGTLLGHVARGNPLWRDVACDAESLVIFQGPETFISPSWYPSKKETAKVVPTWNYAVVHAYGRVRVIDDAVWLRAHVEQLTDRHEAERPAPWKVTDAPADYIETMLRGIVGIEIRIARLVGKWKASQNRSARDRAGVVDGLLQEPTEAAATMAELVRASDASHTP